MRVRLNEYRQRLHALAQKTLEMGSTPIFVTQPTRYWRFKNQQLEGLDIEKVYEGKKINGVDFHHMMKLLDDETLKTCEQLALICIDFGRHKNLSDLDFYDYIHMMPEGARKVADILYSKLKAIELNPRSPSD